MISFVQEIGLPVSVESIDEPSFLPGIMIKDGGLVIDPDKLLYPGDILHEAGHLAVMPPDVRATLNGDLDPALDWEYSGELMAIPWSYAACLHLKLDPAVVFHNYGYRNGSQSIIDNFTRGQYFGVCTLEWIGLCYEPKRNKAYDAAPYPNMIKWLRE